MNKPKRSSIAHPLLAFLFDVYMSSILLRGFMTILAVLTGQKSVFQTAYYILIIISLVLLVIYHSRLKPGATFISPGEMMAGIGAENNGKQWINPYRQKRWLLFTGILISLIYMNASFDEGSFAANTVKLVFYCFLMMAYSEIGRGKKAWAAAPVIYYLLAVLTGVYRRINLAEVVWQEFMANGLFFIAFLVLWISYRKADSMSPESVQVENYSIARLALIVLIPAALVIIISVLAVRAGLVR